jgi:hypothetical protein
LLVEEVYEKLIKLRVESNIAFNRNTFGFCRQRRRQEYSFENQWTEP